MLTFIAQPVCVYPDPINVSLAIRLLICTNQCNRPQGHHPVALTTYTHMATHYMYIL